MEKASLMGLGDAFVYLKSIMSWMWRMPMMLLESGVSVTASDVMLLMSISSSACDIMASWWMCLNEWVMMSAAVSVFMFSWCCTARRISPSVIIPTQLLLS